MRPAAHPSVEALLDRIEGLSRDRQQLRAEHAAGETLEANRVQIVEAQWELSRALILRHLPATP